MLIFFPSYVDLFYSCYAGFEVWSKLQKLEVLDLSKNRLNDNSIPMLVTILSLRSLLLGENYFSSNLTIKRELLSSPIMKTRLPVFFGSVCANCQPHLGNHFSWFTVLFLTFLYRVEHNEAGYS